MFSAKAILFDLDDTLIAFDAVTELSWRQAGNEFFKEHPRLQEQSETIHKTIRKISDWYWSDEIRHRLGRQDLISARRKIVTSAFCELGLPATNATELADNYSKIRLDNMYIFPDSHKLLTYLAKKGIILILITNGDAETQRSKIDRFDLAKFFEHIFIEGEMGFGKPDPRVYELAISTLGLPPAYISMVGDNLIWDVLAPQKTGIKGIWYNRQNRELPSDLNDSPRHIIYELTDLYQIF